MSALPTPDIGAIIPTVKGRKIAYAIFALCSLIVGNAVIYFSTVYTEVPAWIIGISAVLNNTAPVFSSIAMANASNSGKSVEQVVVEPIVPLTNENFVISTTE